METTKKYYRKISSVLFFIIANLVICHFAFSQERDAGSIEIISLPYVNVSNDMNLNYMSSAFTDSINTKLGTADVFHVIEYSNYAQTISSEGIEPSDYNNSQALLQINHITNARYIVYGSFYRQGQNIHISTDIFDSSSNSVVFHLEDTIENDLEIFAVIDTIGTVLLLKFSVFIDESDFYQYDFTPSFFWLKSPLASKYELYIDNQVVYEGNRTEYTLETDLSKGSHTFKTITYICEEIIESEEFIFSILELSVPQMASYPQGEIYDQYPEFILAESNGVEGYKIMIDNQVVYDGSEFSFEIPNTMDFGSYEFTIEFYNPYQRKQTEAIAFEIKELTVSDLVFPQSGEKIFSDTTTSISFQYDNICPVAEYELFINDQSKGVTNEKSFNCPDIEEEGEYSWYIITRAGSQEKRSEILLFDFIHPEFKLGIFTSSIIGISGNIDFNKNTILYGLFKIDYLPLTFLNLTAGAGYGYHKIDINGYSYNYMSNNVDIEYTFLTLYLGAKFKFSYDILGFLGLNKPFHFGFPLGCEINFPISDAITIDDLSYDFNQMTKVYYNFITGLEISYGFNDYFELLFGLYYNLGLTSRTDPVRFDDELEHRITFTLGSYLYKF